MIDGIDGARGTTTTSKPPPPPPAKPSASPSATGIGVCTADPTGPAAASRPDTVHAPTAASASSSPTTTDYAKQILDSAPGWATLAGTAHAAYTAPNEILRSVSAAAAKNSDVASAIRSIAQNWSQMSPAQHAAAASDLVELGQHTGGVEQAAQVIADANAVPQRVANTIEAFSQGNAAQRAVAWAAGTRLGQTLVNRAVNQLPDGAASTLSDLGGTYDAAAASLSAKATTISKMLPGVKTLATSIHDVAADHPNVPGLGALGDMKVVGDIPIVGGMLTAGAIGYDVGVDHENPVEATTKETAGTLASQAAYNGTRDLIGKVATSAARSAAGEAAESAGTAALETTAESAVADTAVAAGGDALAAGAAEAGADVIAASGPVGWAVAGGVLVGAAAGYAVTKFVEGSSKDIAAAVTKGGGEMVDGIAHGNVGEIESGAATAGKDLVNGAVNGVKSVGDGFSDVGKSIGGFVSSIF